MSTPDPAYCVNLTGLRVTAHKSADRSSLVTGLIIANDVGWIMIMDDNGVVWNCSPVGAAFHNPSLVNSLYDLAQQAAVSAYWKILLG